MSAANIVITQESIALDGGLIMAKAAITRSIALGCNMAVAVVDQGGNLLAFLRCIDAPLAAITLAQNKAYTAATFRVPTAVFAERLKDRPEMRQALGNVERITLVGGGVPILINGRFVGAIGVSGGTSEQDVECAFAGLAAIGAA